MKGQDPAVAWGGWLEIRRVAAWAGGQEGDKGAGVRRPQERDGEIQPEDVSRVWRQRTMARGSWADTEAERSLLGFRVAAPMRWEGGPWGRGATASLCPVRGQDSGILRRGAGLPGPP